MWYALVFIHGNVILKRIISPHTLNEFPPLYPSAFLAAWSQHNLSGPASEARSSHFLLGSSGVDSLGRSLALLSKLVLGQLTALGTKPPSPRDCVWVAVLVHP